MLDWLATEFVKQKWSLKAMHRLMMMSAVYRQSSAVTPDHQKLDPDNALWSRMPLVRDAMPCLARCVDDISLIRSMYTTNLTHEPAIYLMQSCKMAAGRPVLGSWVVYGLGSENQNLPTYVVLDDPFGLPINGVENWQSGFLPSMF